MPLFSTDEQGRGMICRIPPSHNDDECDAFLESQTQPQEKSNLYFGWAFKWLCEESCTSPNLLFMFVSQKKNWKKKWIWILWTWNIGDTICYCNIHLKCSTLKIHQNSNFSSKSIQLWTFIVKEMSDGTGYEIKMQIYIEWLS